MRRSALAVLAVLAACGSSANSTTDAASDAAPDAPAAMVTGRYVVREVRNDTNHLPAIDETSYQAITGTVMLPDGSMQPVTVAADGTFSFARHAADERYALTLVVDGGIPTTYEHTAARLDFSPRVWGRHDRGTTPAGTALHVQMTNGPTATPIVQSTGLWTQNGRTNGSPSDFTIDWTSASSLSGPIAPLDATQNDRIYLTSHEYVGYYRISQACSVDVTMTPGMQTTASCALANVTADRCLHLRAKVATEDARLATATQGTPSYTIAGWNWLVLAIPAPTLGPGAGLYVAYYGENNAPGADLDRDMTTFSNPFPGHDLSFQALITRSRSIAAPGATPTTIAIFTQYFVPGASDCTTVTDATLAPVAIPGLPSFDGVALDNDRISLAIDRSRPHELTFPSGDADYWNVRLFSVTNASGATAVNFVHSWVTLDRKITVMPEDLPPGSYLFQILAARVSPSAATGDFRTIGYPSSPYSFGTMWSGMFEVTE